MALGCGLRWRPAPPDEATLAPTDATPVVKIHPPTMGLTVSINTDSDIESYVIDYLSVNGVEPLELPINIGGLTAGLATRRFLKVEMDQFNKHLADPGPKPWKLRRKVVWKSGKTVSGELSGVLQFP